MNRLIAATLFALAALGLGATTATSASAAQHCRPHTGEQQLARSAQAVVLARTVKESGPYPLQIITGCSRFSGKRRILDTLQRRDEDDSARLIGVRLAGTRVAYLLDRGQGVPTIMAEDAVHGGRRHDVGAGGWPFGASPTMKVAWAVDAQGNVAWLTTDGSATETQQVVGAWHPGLGRRMLDSHAVLGDLTLRDGVVRWRRNGAARSVKLASVPGSQCGALSRIGGTLDVDLVVDYRKDTLTACLRATGRTISRYVPTLNIADVNGPYVLLGWAHVRSYTTLIDLATGVVTEPPGGGHSGVVDDHGSVAWLSDGLWVQDAGGTRKVADVLTGSGVLQRDGSTVRVSNGGPTVTLNP